MKKIALLVLVLILGAFLRFYRLGDVPKGLHRDEAFLGYNAYSLAKTGKDMSGAFLPLNLQSFLYSPAGYSYLSIPFVRAFGLSSFSVRFAAALFGTLTIGVTYFLSLWLLKKQNIALLSSFFLAISPWHINLSRTATENTVVVFFITLGILLFLKNRLIVSFLAFSVTLAIYQGPRAFLPFFIPLMVITLGVPKYQWHRAFALYIITIIIPIAFILLSPQLSLRIKTVSLFATQETQLVINEQLREDGVSETPTTIARFFHNKVTGYTDLLLKNYFSHFSYEFLFTDKGLPDRYRIPNVGLFYLFELPLLILGTGYLWQKNRRVALFLLGWIIIAPIGSALAFDDVPNLQRTLLVFPVPSILIAIGATIVWQKKSIIKIVLIFFALYNIIFYLHSYYVHQLVHRPWFRHEGYQELVSQVNTLLPNYKKAVITNRESAPAIFFLFYGRYDPAKFQTETFSPVPHDLDRIAFGKYEFSQEECPLRLTKTGFTGIPHVLYVNFGTCESPKDYATELAQIKRGDDTVVFKILKSN